MFAHRSSNRDFYDLGLKAKRHIISIEYAVYQRKCITLRIGIYAISETMSKIIGQNTPITVLSSKNYE